jgi:hypothetical protein
MRAAWVLPTLSMGSTVSSVATTCDCPHPLGHALVQGFDQIGHVPAPHRLRGPRNLESLARENLFQPVQRQVIGKLAGDDVSQQPGPASPRSRGDSARAATVICGFSPEASHARRHTSCAHADALEVPGKVLDLPALLRADLLPLLAAARAGALFPAQLVDVRGDRQILEVASARLPLRRFTRRNS